MTTPEFITLLLEYTAASLTRTRALFYVNQAQNEILGTDHPVTRVQPDPYFNTQEEVYSYIANNHCRNADVPADPGDLVGDIRSVESIYAFIPGWGWYWGWGIPWSNFCRVRPERVNYGRGEWSLDARFSVVQSSEPMANDCLVKWQKPNNPGLTAYRWYAQVYLWPNQLLTESVALTVPADFQRSLLLEATLAMIEQRSYGREGYPKEAFDADMRRFLEKYTNTPVQEDTGFVPFRDC